MLCLWQQVHSSQQLSGEEVPLCSMAGTYTQHCAWLYSSPLILQSGPSLAASEAPLQGEYAMCQHGSTLSLCSRTTLPPCPHRLADMSFLKIPGLGTQQRAGMLTTLPVPRLPQRRVAGLKSYCYSQLEYVTAAILTNQVPRSECSSDRPQSMHQQPLSSTANRLQGSTAWSCCAWLQAFEPRSCAGVMRRMLSCSSQFLVYVYRVEGWVEDCAAAQAEACKGHGESFACG